MDMQGADPGFGLYVHWPFCLSKCPYCDFNSHVAASIDQKRWERAFLSELDRCGRESGGRVLRSVFFGGGTPSLMSPDLVGAILERVRARWPMSNDPEVTLEANPTSVEAGRFAAFREAGVNRVSIGVQALNDTALRQLGRTHGASEARRAIDIAQDNFPRFSFDLIYARQGQGLEDWRAELREALSIGSRHLSLYQLTIEEGTVFFERNRRGLLHGLPDEDLSADLYELTQDMCEGAGLPAYEVSNHAAPGEESRHNMIYWRGGDYLGIGPGAHGRLSQGGQRIMTECHHQPDRWLAAVEVDGSGELPRTALEPEALGTELLMMGLRMVSGVSQPRIQAALGRDLDEQRLADLEAAGLIWLKDGLIGASRAGRLVLNSLLGEILATRRRL